MTVYEAARVVERHLKEKIPATTVQTNGIIGICNGTILEFSNEGEAIRLNDNSGWLFNYQFRNGTITLKPFS